MLTEWWAKYLGLINLWALALFFIDKRRSIKGQWRIKESTLLITALLGGSIGAIIGMNWFRHKTKHAKFKIGLPLILCLQLLLIYCVKNRVNL